MTTGEHDPSESAGYRPPGHGEPPRAPGSGSSTPGSSWPAPGQQGADGRPYPPPAGGHQAPESGPYPPPGTTGGGYPGGPGAPHPGFGQPGHPQSGWGQPGWGQPTYGQPGAGQPLSPQEERTWALAAHLSALVGIVIGLSFLGPLVVMLVQGPRSAYVRAQAVEALNFNLSMLIYMIAAIVLSFTIILFFLPILVGILWLVLVIIAGVKAGNGEPFRYPLTIRMVS